MSFHLSNPNFSKLKKIKNIDILNIFNTNKNDVKIINKENYNKNKKPNIKILEYISIAKILASLSVVILHTNSAFWFFNYNEYKNFWINANLIENIFYFAVPFFVLCIGATLLDFNEKYGLRKYYYRRITKVLVPLISWSIILYFYKIYIIKNMKKQKISFVYIWNLYYGHQIYMIFSSFHIF